MTNKLTVAYVRCSSDMQSVEHQIQSIDDYAKKHNLIIDKVFKDEGISAYRKDYSYRDGFKELLQLAKKGEVENLLIFESSRLSRNMIEYQMLVQQFTNCNVRIHDISTNSIINQNELDTLLNAFKGWMNQNSSKQTSMRVKSAKKLLKEKGKFLGGTILYGFEVIDGYEVPIEDMKPIINEFFDDYISKGRKYVSEKYNIKNRKTIINRIANKKYIDIVGSDKWHLANQIRTNRVCEKYKETKALNRTEKLLEGLVYHKHCGSKLNLYRDRNNRGTIFRCLKCKGKSSAESIKKSFSGESLTANIEYEILNIFDNFNHDKLIEKYASKCYQKEAIIEFKIKELSDTHKTKLHTLKLSKVKLQESILTGAPATTIDAISNIINEVSIELETIDNDLVIYNQQLDKLREEDAHQNELIENILEAKDIYRRASDIQKKAILQLLIKKIEVSDTDKFDIFLNI